MSGFIKARAIPTGSRSFGDQARRAAGMAARGSFRVIDGQYNGFYPREEKALWFALCPTQAWSFDIYDREAGEVVHLDDQLYYAYVNHRVAASGRNFQCSAGAHKDKPCWGCGVRNHFYEMKELKRQKTGIDAKGEAPISAMTQYAFAGVLLENVAKVPSLDKNGNVKKKRNGEVIMKDMPLGLLPKNQRESLKQEGATSFGLRVHYSTGITHLNALIGFDEDMKNYCANCAQQLYAHLLACPECGETMKEVDEEGGVLQGQALKEVREVDYKCECGYYGPLLPLVECDCGNAQEGKLVDFAIKLISEKVGEKQRNLRFTDVRLISSFVEKYPDVQDMLDKPLALNEIFAPTRLESQTYMVPENMRGDGVSPAPRAKKAAGPVEGAYPLKDDEDEDEEDANDDDE